MNTFNKKEKEFFQIILTVDTLGYYLISEVLGEAKQALPFLKKIH